MHKFCFMHSRVQYTNFDSCAILNSQAPKIFCLQNNVDFLGNSEVAFFFIHPVDLFKYWERVFPDICK